MTIWKIRFFLYKRYLKGFAHYAFLTVTNPESIKRIELETKAVRDLEATNVGIDRRLYRDPDSVSINECQEASENEFRIKQAKQTLEVLRKERFEQLLFALG